MIRRLAGVIHLIGILVRLIVSTAACSVFLDIGMLRLTETQGFFGEIIWEYNLVNTSN